MERILGGYAAQLYAMMRIVVGFLFACHGAQKLFGMFGSAGDGGSVPLFSLMGLAGAIEFFGGLLVAIGLIASYAAFVSSGEMAAAYFMGHLPKGLWPIENGGELAVLYCFVFLYIAARGAGIWSVDASIGSRRRLD